MVSVHGLKITIGIDQNYKTWFEICKDFSSAYYLLENALQ
jgi:hypothetical protein